MTDRQRERRSYETMPGTSTLSDEDLMLQVQRNKLQQAAELFERYQVKLYNFFLYHRFDETTSEDLTQTVFERMIRYRQSYRSEASFRTWLYQIARNVRLDTLKSRQQAFSNDFTEVEQLAVIEESVLEKQETNQNLHKAMRHLPDEYREVLVLTRFQQLKYAEVANLLNLTESAVKVRVHRAIKQLRENYFKIEEL